MATVHLFLSGQIFQVFRHIVRIVTRISVKGFLCFYFLNFVRIILHVVLLPLLFLNSASVLTKDFVGINDIAQFSPAFHPFHLIEYLGLKFNFRRLMENKNTNHCLLSYSSWQTNQIRQFVFWENLQRANLLLGFI